MRYGVEGTEQDDLQRWPNPPNVPRYLYAGELTGEANYALVERDNRSQAERVFAWVVGLVLTSQNPRQLQRPQGVVVDAAGRILVTDLGQGAVFVFDEPAGKLFVWDRAEQFTPFVSPIGIATTASGEVLVADAELGLVARLDAEGNPLGTFGQDLLVRPTGLARNDALALTYVSDTQAHDIKVFDDLGQLVDTIGTRGERLGQFNYPTHLAFRDGKLYVADTMNARIQVLDETGEVLTSFGERGLYLGNFARPKGVAIDEDQNIYVIESYFDHLLVYNASGEFLLPIGGEGDAPGRFYLPGGAHVDGRSRVFVADTFNGRVSIFQYLGSG
jgi:DNA-binding beta-propeller fold protein YncE